MRYTYQTITDYSSPLGLEPGSANNTGATSLDVIEHNFSGKVGLQYKFTPNWVSYAVTVTRGYKGPQAEAAMSPRRRFSCPPRSPLLRARIEGDDLGGSSVLYRYTLLYARPQLSGAKLLTDPGRCARLRAELGRCHDEGYRTGPECAPDSQLEPERRLYLRPGEYPGSYLGENPNALVGPDTTLPLGGLQVIGVPRNKFTTSSDYTLPLGPVGLFIGADLVYKSSILEGPSPDPRFTYPAHWTLGARLGIRASNDAWGVTIFGRDLNNAHEPVTLFGGPAFVPPGVVPFLPFGAISGVSGWMGPQSLRQVGISFDLHL